MEGLRAHATDWSQNIQNMSVDFRIAGKIDDPFRRRRRRRRHHRSRNPDPNVSATAAPEGEEGQNESETESESYSSSYSSNESQSGSESDSQATQTEQVPEEKTTEDKEQDPHLSQPLDFFGENLAFIDESSDAQSGKLHLDPLLDPTQPNSATSRPHKRRRQRRPVPQRNHKGNRVPRSNNDKTEHNGNPQPVPDLKCS